MFILRKIEDKGWVNVILGERYRIIHRREHWREFNKLQKRFGPNLDIFAYVTSAMDDEEGMVIEPLYKENRYYIVLEDGNTYERITEID